MGKKEQSARPGSGRVSTFNCKGKTSPECQGRETNALYGGKCYQCSDRFFCQPCLRETGYIEIVATGTEKMSLTRCNDYRRCTHKTRRERKTKLHDCRVLHGSSCWGCKKDRCRAFRDKCSNKEHKRRSGTWG